MSWVAGISLLLLLPMAAVAVLNLFRAPRLERVPPPARRPRVSLLVPARNEAVNLRETLPPILRVHYDDLEILLLDDDSTDDTAAVVQAHAEGLGGERLRLIRGAPLPAGWAGKNWACHQLATAAVGEVLIFCDADVTVGPDAILRTVGALERYGAGAATALPRQRFEQWYAAAVVPLIAQLPVIATLPLPLVPRTSAPSLSMGNGQWLAFTRECYAGVGGHAAVRASLVEDVALARRVKRSGRRLVALAAARDLEVQMYRDAAGVREGFSKNLYLLAGGRPLSFFMVLTVFLLTAVAPWLGMVLGRTVMLLPLALLLLVRLCGAVLLRQSAAPLLLHPVGSILVVVLGLESMLRARRGAVWKGRVTAVAGR